MRRLALPAAALMLVSCGAGPQVSSERQASGDAQRSARSHRDRRAISPRESVDVPVPASCTPDVNARLGSLMAAETQSAVDNVMVCGTSVSASRRRTRGPHGAHDLIPVLAPFPDGSSRLVEVVVNEDLDGRVTAPAHASVFAFGQAYFDNTGQFAAGIHDVHCATHPGAKNGWVVVNGDKMPGSCPRR